MKFLKVFSEKSIKVNWEEESTSEILARIDKIAGQKYREGWFFTHSQADALLENLVLFFEREQY